VGRGGRALRLTNVHVENFKCIENSTPFRIDRVTCFVGKNEAGKSALLQALYKLNPVVGSEEFVDLEYPRRRWSEYKERRGASPDNVLTTEWELDDGDRNALTAVLGPDTLKSDKITITKGYENQPIYDVSVDEKKVVRHIVSQADLSQGELQSIGENATVAGAVAKLQAVAERSERQNKLLDLLTKTFPASDVASVAIKVLHARLPKFVYFANYQKMPGQVALDAFAQRKAAQQLTFEDRVFEALIDLAGVTTNGIQTITKFEPLIAELEAVSARLTDEIFAYWSQNKHLRVDFRFDAARSEDPAPFNSGYIFRTRIWNNRHSVSVGFDDRSSGFVWFFSFLVWFSQVKKNYGDRLIILLDEPGLSLHARAQADLLRYIRQKLMPDYQVLYSTHSPFMVDGENLTSARTVEDIVTDTGEVLGTKVGDDVLSTDADTVFPLQAALGYDVTQTLFVGKHNIAVEGPSDYLYLTWFSTELRSRSREGLDRRWRIAPTGGIDKIASFVSLFGANKLHIAVLSDYHSGDKKKVNDLRTSKLLRDGHVFTAETYVGQPEADIEDLIGRANYTELVNRAFSLDPPQRLPVTKPEGVPALVVREVEGHFRVLPPGSPEFDHYVPAEYLMANSTRMKKVLPDLDSALDRFEKLFADLNKLLPPAG
jgi:predicted ATPase